MRDFYLLVNYPYAPKVARSCFGVACSAIVDCSVCMERYGKERKERAPDLVLLLDLAILLSVGLRACKFLQGLFLAFFDRVFCSLSSE